MSSQLDKIISDGQTKPEAAMLVFAMELKSLSEKVESVNKTINDGNQMYVTKMEFKWLVDEVALIKKGIIAVLSFVFFSFLGGIISFIWVTSRGGK